MYIATLQTKRGELRGLNLLNLQNTNSEFIPNLIIKESTQEELDRILTAYEGNCLIDTRQLEFYEYDSLHQILANEPNYDHLNIVYPLDYAMIHDVIPTSYIRIFIPDLDDYSFTWLETNLIKLPQNIIIDFGYISSTPSQLNLFSVQKIITMLGNRNIVILSGSIPKSVPENSSTDYIQPRYEKELYQLLSRMVSIDLQYADYCTIHPQIDNSGFGRAVVQIKYTLDTDYHFFRNGLFQGNYDVKSLYQNISKLPLFSSDLSWGDEYILENSKKEIPGGSPEYWVSIAVNHHIQWCLEENI